MALPAPSSSSSSTDVDKWLALSPSNSSASSGRATRPALSPSRTPFVTSPGGTTYLAAPNSSVNVHTHQAKIGSHQPAAGYGKDKGKQPIGQLEPGGAEQVIVGGRIAAVAQQFAGAGSEVRLKKDGTPQRKRGPVTGQATKVDGSPRRKSGPAAGARLRLDGTPRLKPGPKTGTAHGPFDSDHSPSSALNSHPLSPSPIRASPSSRDELPRGSHGAVAHIPGGTSEHLEVTSKAPSDATRDKGKAPAAGPGSAQLQIADGKVRLKKDGTPAKKTGRPLGSKTKGRTSWITGLSWKDPNNLPAGQKPGPVPGNPLTKSGVPRKRPGIPAGATTKQDGTPRKKPGPRSGWKQPPADMMKR